MVKKKTEEVQEPKKVTKSSKKDYIFTVGRRREAVARVRLYPSGNGSIIVNTKPVEEYFRGEANKVGYMLPFVVTETINKFNTTIKVAGGGPSGQLGAAVHGISRAIEKFDKEKYRALLKKKGLLTRDPRTRERRMVGMGGKARRKKQSPKR